MRTVKLNALFLNANAVVALVNDGVRPTVKVNVCLVTPAELVAVNVIEKVRPAIDVDGVPASVAVPLAPAVKVTPVGSVPVRVMVAAG